MKGIQIGKEDVKLSQFMVDFIWYREKPTKKAIWNNKVAEYKINFQNSVAILETSLVVPWLRIHFAMQGMQVWSLVGELRSHMPWDN